MRTLIFILFIVLIVPSFAQTDSDLNFDSRDRCAIILDSLTKAGYFDKAKQIDLNEVPVMANISFSSGSGCFVRFYDIIEFLYSENAGYILKSRTGLKDKYLKFQGPSVLLDLFRAMNQSHLVDSTLMISNPDHIHTTGQGGMIVRINIEFSSGKTIRKQLSWSNEYCTYKYFQKFSHYLDCLDSLPFKPMDYGIAYYIDNNFTSEISRMIVVQWDNSYPRMESLSPFSDDKIEQVFIIEN